MNEKKGGIYLDKKILIVEDDPEIRNFIKLYLTNDGYETVEVDDGKKVMEVFHAENPDLVILDILLPGLDGIEVCREIRKTSIVPIIFLSNKIDEVDKIIGLTVGADDYITKPFSPRELTARIRSHLRREMYYTDQQQERKSILKFDNIMIDLDRHRIICNNEEIELSAKEFSLLSYMAKHPGRIFTVEELFEKVWGEFSLGDTRTVMVHISSLRKKIERDSSNPQFIITVRGVGYKFMD